MGLSQFYFVNSPKLFWVFGPILIIWYTGFMTSESAFVNKFLTHPPRTRSEITASLEMQDPAVLFQTADRIRKKFVGDAIYLRALIEFSNYCKNDCLYCGIRRSNDKAVRYRMTPDEIFQTARWAVQSGYKTVVLQSGEDVWFDADKMSSLIRRIKQLGAAVTLSLGEKTREEYAAYRQAGADRYLLRIETTDKALYEQLDPAMSWDNRVRCLEDLKELGYEVGSGSLVGLPGQTLDSLADDLLFFKSLPVDMAGIGPFIPHPNTPLAGEPVSGHFELSLKMMAIMRLMLPDINIPATTAMETLHPQGRIRALQCGANVIMPNVTAEQFCRNYELYPGKPHPGASAAAVWKESLASIGRTVSDGYGFHGDYLKGKK